MIDTHFLTASQSIVIETKGIVSHPSFIQFVQDGEIVGEVNATFDFSELPKGYHILALQFLRGHRCILPPTNWEPIRESDVISSRPWWKLW